MNSLRKMDPEVLKEELLNVGIRFRVETNKLWDTDFHELWLKFDEQRNKFKKAWWSTKLLFWQNTFVWEGRLEWTEKDLYDFYHECLEDDELGDIMRALCGLRISGSWSSERWKVHARYEEERKRIKDLINMCGADTIYLSVEDNNLLNYWK